MKRWTGVVAVAVAVASMTACGSSKPDGCATPSGDVIQAIVDGQTMQGLALSAGRAQAVKDGDVYFVAVPYDVDGDTGTAVWATTNITGAGPIRSAEALSATLTRWPRVDGIDAGSQPVRDAIACIG